jgi:gamma-glutamylcyclotransferase
MAAINMMTRTKTFYYFAYGSNLKLSEIQRSCPTAERKWKAKLPDYALVFPRESTKRKCGVASIEARVGHDVWGGVYAIAELERESLEAREGFKRKRAVSANSYVLASLTVLENGHATRPQEVVTFIANPQANPPLPSIDYKNLIIDGAREWKLDGEYISDLELIETSNS